MSENKICGPYVNQSGTVAHVHDDRFSVRLDRLEDQRLEVVVHNIESGECVEYWSEPFGPEDQEIMETQSTEELALEALKLAPRDFKMWSKNAAA